MEKTTKILSLVLAIMLFALPACSAVNPAKKAEETAEATTEAATIETSEETTEETAAETTEPSVTEATEAQEVDAEITEATEAAEPEPNATIVNVSSYVNIRAEQLVSSEKVGTYAKGERIYVETVETSGGVRWGKTMLGWVCMDYVQLDGEPIPANIGNVGSGSVDSDSTPATEETAVSAEAAQTAPEATQTTTQATEATTAPTEAATQPTISATEATEPETTAATESTTEAATEVTAAPTEATTQPTVAETEPETEPIQYCRCGFSGTSAEVYAHICAHFGEFDADGVTQTHSY